MNREIIFKAKRLDNGEWVEGYYAKLGYGKNVKHFIIQNVCLDEDNVYFYDIEIDINTLSQYTGLIDNTKWEELTELEKETFLSTWNYREDRKNKIEDWNGKKIWENDIAHIRSSGLSGYGVIKYENGNLVLVDAKRKRTYSMYGEWKIRKDGNIFDNAELLEVE